MKSDEHFLIQLWRLVVFLAFMASVFIFPQMIANKCEEKEIKTKMEIQRLREQVSELQKQSK